MGWLWIDSGNFDFFEGSSLYKVNVTIAPDFSVTSKVDIAAY